MPLFYPGAQPFPFGVNSIMHRTKTSSAASQLLVSFSFNLPADMASLFMRAAKASGETPQQYAAVAAASLLSSDTRYFEAKFSKAEHFDNADKKVGKRLLKANTRPADSINMNLLASDLEDIIASQEDLLHNDCGFRDLTGLALADAVDAAYRRSSEAADLCKHNRSNADRLRRLLTASLAATEVGK